MKPMKPFKNTVTGLSSKDMSTTLSPITSVNPATEEVLARFDPFTPEEVDRALDEAQDAFRRVARALHRGSCRADAAARRRCFASAPIVTDGSSRSRWGSRSPRRRPSSRSAPGAPSTTRRTPRAISPTRSSRRRAQRSLVAFQPLGIVLAVMPWNFPFWQVIRFAAPALMAGNAAVLKHASNVPQCALAIEEAVRDAGFPEGLLRTVLLAGSAVEPVIADPRIRAVTLTGSSDTGSRIAELAGRALKKSVLELGRLRPVHRARRRRSRRGREGRRASAQPERRAVVHRGQALHRRRIRRARLRAAVRRARSRRFASATRSIPRRRSDRSREPTCATTLERQVRESVRMGARVLTGGERGAGKGWYYQPTVLADVTEDMPVFKEETFGPVAAVLARPRRRRGGARRERLRLRSRRQPLDARPGARRGARAKDRVGLRLRERHGRLRPAPAVRRRQAQRLRPRARLVRDQGVREHPDDLDRPTISRGSQRPHPRSERRAASRSLPRERGRALRVRHAGRGDARPQRGARGQREDRVHPHAPRAGRRVHGRRLRAAVVIPRRVPRDARSRRDQPADRCRRCAARSRAARRDHGAGRASSAFISSRISTSTSSRCSRRSRSGARASPCRSPFRRSCAKRSGSRASRSPARRISSFPRMWRRRRSAPRRSRCGAPRIRKRSRKRSTARRRSSTPRRRRSSWPATASRAATPSAIRPSMRSARFVQRSRISAT